MNELHPLTKDLISHIQDKYQLSDYVLHETFYRREKIRGETQYSLETCWFPINHGPWSEDESYPDGTIEIQVDTATRRTTSINKHGDVTIILFEDLRDSDTQTSWLEQELGMTFDQSSYYWSTKIRCISMSAAKTEFPLPCFFHFAWLTDDGALDFFSVYGTPALSNNYPTESFSLSPVQITPIITEQIRFFSAPGDQQRIQAHAIEKSLFLKTTRSRIPLVIQTLRPLPWTRSWHGTNHLRSPTRANWLNGDAVTARDAEAQTPHPITDRWPMGHWWLVSQLL